MKVKTDQCPFFESDDNEVAMRPWQTEIKSSNCENVLLKKLYS